jgi:TRAP transporter 4TM/12TM fusion protein
VLVWALMSGYSPFRAGGLGILTALVAGWLSGLFHDLGVSLKPAPDSAAAVFAALVLRFVALVAVGGLFYGTLVYGSQIAAERFGPWTGIAVGIALVAVPALLFGWRRTLQGLNLAARDTIQLVAVCAVAGIIVGVVALTGIGGRFSEMILGIAGANQLIAMVFVAMVALILGMGMPTTAAYAIGAAVLAPGLGRIGVEALVAHFFIFYFAVLSSITPPVALASFAAAGMAQADPWKTSWIALKMGLATFIVPFMFYFSPVLLWKGSTLSIIQAAVTGSIGVWFLASSTEGWFGGRLAMPLRVLMFGAALCLLHPGSITDLIGLAIGVPIYLWQRLRKQGQTTFSR